MRTSGLNSPSAHARLKNSSEPSSLNCSMPSTRISSGRDELRICRSRVRNISLAESGDRVPAGPYPGRFRQTHCSGGKSSLMRVQMLLSSREPFRVRSVSAQRRRITRCVSRQRRTSAASRAVLPAPGHDRSHSAWLACGSWR